MATVALTYMALPTGPIKLAFTSIIITALLVSVTKPDVFYRDATTSSGKQVRKLRDFGTSDHDTLLPAWLAMVGAGYVVYIISMSTQLLS